MSGLDISLQHRKEVKEENISFEEWDSILTIAEFSGVKLPFVTTPAAPVASTPRVKMAEAEAPAKKLEEKYAAEIQKLRAAYLSQKEQMEELISRQKEMSFNSTQAESHEKVPLPPKYEGNLDFKNYLVQFEALASEQKWSTSKKGVMLLSRLKGRALDIAAQGEDLSYSQLVAKLKSHFSPEHEEMYAQKLQTIQKKPKQSWEDLAFEVKDLASKAYRSTNEATIERLAVHAFVNAIEEDILRQKLRDMHPTTLQSALEKVRQIEADQAIEKQRVRQQHPEDTQKEAAKAVHQTAPEDRVKELEEQLKKLQAEFKSRQTNRPEAGRVPQPGARQSG